MLMGSNGREAPGPATAAGASKGGQVRGGRSSKFMGVVSKFQARLGLGLGLGLGLELRAQHLGTCTCTRTCIRARKKGKSTK